MKAIIYVVMAFALMGVSHCKKNEPLPPNVKLYIGDSEDNAFCRENDDGSSECIYVDEFDSYHAMSVDDVSKVLNYINELRHKCSKFEGEK